MYRCKSIVDEDKLTLDDINREKIPKYYQVQPWQYLLFALIIVFTILMAINNAFDIMSEPDS